MTTRHGVTSYVVYARAPGSSDWRQPGKNLPTIEAAWALAERYEGRRFETLITLQVPQRSPVQAACSARPDMGPRGGTA